MQLVWRLTINTYRLGNVVITECVDKQGLQLCRACLVDARAGMANLTSRNQATQAQNLFANCDSGLLLHDERQIASV